MDYLYLYLHGDKKVLSFKDGNVIKFNSLNNKKVKKCGYCNVRANSGKVSFINIRGKYYARCSLKALGIWSTYKAYSSTGSF